MYIHGLVKRFFENKWINIVTDVIVLGAVLFAVAQGIARDRSFPKLFRESPGIFGILKHLTHTGRATWIIALIITCVALLAIVIWLRDRSTR